jgi:hypothetical protein
MAGVLCVVMILMLRSTWTFLKGDTEGRVSTNTVSQPVVSSLAATETAGD